MGAIPERTVVGGSVSSPMLTATIGGIPSTSTSIILLSEDAAIQQHLLEQVPGQLAVVTRTMLLNADWRELRDRLLQKPATVIMELPRCRTSSGTRNDRRVADRMVSFVVPSGTFTIFGPRRSNAWEVSAIQTITQMPGVHSSLHSACAWGLTST